MFKTLCAILTALVASLAATGAAAQWHPGVPGQDAPGGTYVQVESNGIRLEAIMYRPDGDTGPRPAIIIVPGWAPYNTRPVEEYTYVAQEYAKAGFVAVAITSRGWAPTGGSDDCGLSQPADVVNVAHWLRRQPGVDPDNIGLMGQSLGGQIVLSAAALDDRLKAVVAYFPITDFQLWGETTSLPQAVKDDYIYGMCARAGTPADRSPLFSADRITASVLLMHGDKDNNVVFRHSQLLYDKMKAADLDVTLFTAVNGGHGSGGPGWEDHNAIAQTFFRQKFDEKN